MLTHEEVLEKARNNRVKFFRLQFTDTFGALKNIAVTSEDLERAMAGRIAFDGSVVDGVMGSLETDILLQPDLNTFAEFPWRPRESGVARFLCDIANTDGSPYPGCSRNALKQVITEASQMGVEVLMGAKVDFYLFHTDAGGNPSTDIHDSAGFCDLTPVDMGENARRDMVLTLEEMGFDIGSSHHGLGPSQHRIALKPDSALATADKLVTFKFIVRTIAQRHGLHASLMPKPLNSAPGSDLHLHLFLSHDDMGPFSDSKPPPQPSPETSHFIGGILNHAPAYTAITNPLINSYKRLIPGDMAPRKVAWSQDSRSALLRVVANPGQETRLEIRSPDPACNPYLALAVILKSGLDGIRQKISMPPPLSQGQGVSPGCLPRTLEEALGELASDQVVRAALGEDIYQRFVWAKKKEWERFQAFVHPWELQEYLTDF